jgi:UDPglucose--hexose-1-phosphate uridylyltransferase
LTVESRHGEAGLSTALTDEPRVPELRRDPISDRWVALAPWRASRPGAATLRIAPATADELASCPFCEGREDQTPPELLAVAPPGRVPDTPGWTTRVVPNKYPAFEHHEVVIHSPRHARSIADLTGEEIAAVAEAWALRGEAARDGGYLHPQLVINEGREAGASLPHSHSQIVWLAERPPLVEIEARSTVDGACELCRMLVDEERAGERLIARSGDVLAVAPYASRSPYEFLVAAPGDHYQPGILPFSGRAFLETSLNLIVQTVRRLHELEGAVPLNVWLHDPGHPHFEVVPRFSTHAGFELGAGIYLNSLAPEDAAARLRGD